MARRTLLLLLSVVLSVAVIAPVAAAPSFTDVPDSSIFSGHIEWLARVGITEGCNPPANDNFCPKDYVTRGQMAAFLVRGLGLTDAGGGDHFDDDNNNIFESSIDKLYTAGITSGCNPPTNNHYCPNSYVTRGQMAAFLVRGLGLTDAGGGDHFDDDNNNIFESSIDKLYTAGITSGCNPPTNNHYCPNANVTREQMAAFLRRGLDDPPPKVTGVSVRPGGGSTEIAVFWDTSPDLDVDDYNVWHSYAPGGTKTLVVNPYVGPEPTTGERWWIVDWFVSLDPGYDCYQVSAIDMAGQEGPRSAEACFDPFPGTPSQVTNVVATTSGGSGEIAVSWSAVPEGDIDHYNVWYSYAPGDAKVLITDPWQGPQPLPGNRWEIVDFPYSLSSGYDCFQVSAVDLTGQEGPRSAEACFDSTPGPPSQVTNVVATTSGGSGEIAVYWDEVPELDVNDYNVWYSEFPGGTKTQLTDPIFGPVPTTGDRWYIIDYPYPLTVGRDCFEISAVDLSGNEGLRSAEACFAP